MVNLLRLLENLDEEAYIFKDDWLTSDIFGMINSPVHVDFRCILWCLFSWIHITFPSTRVYSCLRHIAWAIEWKTLFKSFLTVTYGRNNGLADMLPATKCCTLYCNCHHIVCKIRPRNRPILSKTMVLLHTVVCKLQYTKNGELP